MKDFEVFEFSFIALIIFPLGISSLGLFFGYILGLAELNASLNSGLGALLATMLLVAAKVINANYFQPKLIEQLLNK